jgi:starch synthase
LLLPWDVFTLDKVEHYDTFNFLKGGIIYSDFLTTVSRKYAEEIKTAEFGHTLDSIIRRRSDDLRGILNGVDYDKWNPATDKLIAADYSQADLSGKAVCRRDLLQSFGLENIADTTPILGIISRFAEQKGFDILAQIATQLMERDIVLLGIGTGESQYENFFRVLSARYPGKVSVKIIYDEALSHKIEAGSDIFLMPSRYEPCGLNQIYSLKYGTVPVVRATGGLDDTIDEWNPELTTGTGFKFYGYRAQDFLGAIDRAINVFKDKQSWQTLMLNGMKMNYSWEQSAKEYEEVYELVSKRRS